MKLESVFKDMIIGLVKRGKKIDSAGGSKENLLGSSWKNEQIQKGLDEFMN